MPVFAVHTFEWDPDIAAHMIAHAKDAMHGLSTMDGFMRAQLLQNSERSKILIMSEWDSAHSWSVMQWNEKLSTVIAELVESSRRHDFDMYSSIEREPSP